MLLNYKKKLISLIIGKFWLNSIYSFFFLWMRINNFLVMIISLSLCYVASISKFLIQLSISFHLSSSLLFLSTIAFSHQRHLYYYHIFIYYYYLPTSNPFISNHLFFFFATNPLITISSSSNVASSFLLPLLLKFSSLIINTHRFFYRILHTFIIISTFHRFISLPTSLP